MYTRFVESLSNAFFESDLVATRMTLAVSEILWAIMLLWPGHLFSRPTYHYMAHAGSETTWALIFGASAIGQLYILASRCFQSAFARNFSFWNASLWWYVVVSMLCSVYPPPAAISGEIALAIAAAWIWVRPFIVIAGLRKTSGFVPLH